MPEQVFSGQSEQLAAQHTWQDLPGHSPDPSELIRAVIMPLIAGGALPIACMAFNQTFDGHHLILALLVISFTFPGEQPLNNTGRMTRILDVLLRWSFTIGLLGVLGLATKTIDVFNQHVIIAWATLTPCALLTVELVLPSLITTFISQGSIARVAVIAGGGELADHLCARIAQTPHLGMRIAGYFDDRQPERIGPDVNCQRLGRLDQIVAYAKQNRVHIIYINLPMTVQPRILGLLDELRDTTASIYFMPDIFVFDLIQARVDTIGGMPVLAVCETPFQGLNGYIKRASDLVLASLILLLVAPVMLAIAIAITATSPGPVLFRQRRYGLDGREIVVYKFRSMTVCEDNSEIRQATRNDSRVTRLGAFLRTSSLDELPQFINVLQGRMSVVGPRPHAVAHNEMYRKLIKGYMIRHKVRPGITGFAQVNGQRGETATLDRMQARIAYDLAYLRNWSLALDLQIVLKTIVVVWRRDNAY